MIVGVFLFCVCANADSISVVALTVLNLYFGEFTRSREAALDDAFSVLLELLKQSKDMDRLTVLVLLLLVRKFVWVHSKLIFRTLERYVVFVAVFYVYSLRVSF